MLVINMELERMSRGGGRVELRLIWGLMWMESRTYIRTNVMELNRGTEHRNTNGGEERRGYRKYQRKKERGDEGVLEGEVYELDTDMHMFSHSVVKYLRLTVFFK